MADFFAKGKNPINGYGGVDEGVIYSTEEHIIGKWIDGSILYEKTVNCGLMGNNTTTRTPHNISNFGYTYSIECLGVRTTPAISYALPASDAFVSVDNTNVNIQTTSNWSVYNAYVTIRYTKTS